MKILFVWTGVTSYMADCWRELRRWDGVELKVVVEQVVSGKEFDVEKVLSGIDCTVVRNGDCSVELVPGWCPDVMFAVGWHSKVVRRFVSRRDWREVPKVCCFDLPWDGSFRRILARWVLAPFLRLYSAAYVPGVACEKYARWLGFCKIFKGLFSIDGQAFASAVSDAPRRGFLYMGRFAEEKRIDVLIAAFARYRALGGTWTFDLYGSGTMKPMLEQLIDRICDGQDARRPSLASLQEAKCRLHDFVQPDEVPRIYAEHGCLVLASDFDPWPLVVLQACANGMPVVVSDRCTNYPELVRGNGIVCPTGDVEAMAQAMLRVEHGEVNGEAGRELSEPYDKVRWCERTLAICREVSGK